MLQIPFLGGTQWLRDQSREQFQTIEQQIDSGQPVPIGLIGTTLNPFHNHQVLCYGYDDPGDGTGSLILYDNNLPGTESRIDFDLRGNMLSTTRDDTLQTERGPLRGFFATVYSPQVPPKAVVLSQSLVIPQPECAQAQEPVDATYAVQNIGYHQSPPMALKVVSDDGMVGGEAALTSLDQGSARSVDALLTFSGPGKRSLTVMADLGTWASIPIHKHLPPADTWQIGSAGVNVLPLLPIGVRAGASDDPCSASLAASAGATATFFVKTNPLVPPGTDFQWSVTGASGLANNAPTFQVQMPTTVGVSVTVSVVVNSSSGCRRSGSLTLVTLGPWFAKAEAAFCSFHTSLQHIVLRLIPPLGKERPPFPLGESVTKADLAALQASTEELLEALNEALATSQGGAAILSSPGQAVDMSAQTNEAIKQSDVSVKPTGQTNEALEATLIMPSPSAGVRRLLQLPSGRTVTILTKQVIVGRGITDTAEAAAIDFSAEQEKATVSRMHAQLMRVGDRVEIEDLNSANGTLLNDQKLFPGQYYPLHNGDVIAFGRVRCVFKLG